MRWGVAARNTFRAFRMAWLVLLGGLVLAPVAVASVPISDQRLLDSIVIQQVRLGDRPLSEVVRYLDQLLESKLPEDLSLNVLFVNPDDRDPEVNLRLRNVSVAALVDFIARQTGTSYDLSEGVLIFSTRPSAGADAASSLQTEIFPVSRSTIIRITGVR